MTVNVTVTALSLIHSGVRFVRVPTPMLTQDGHRFSYPKLTVMGPPDAGLVERIKEAVASRDLKSLEAARRRVLAGREKLNPGECETCGEQVPTVIGDKVVTNCGNGMCQLCMLNRERYVLGEVK